MSSYNVIMIPVAVALFSRANGLRRLIYGSLALVLEAALLCSLTRSSWVGGCVALALLFLNPEIRERAATHPKPHGLLACAAVAMALAWPSSTIVSGYDPSVIGRITEVVSAARSHAVYGSFHQRLLIWTSGWLMGSENPLTGKGYGLFELYYPFFQGPLVAAYDSFHMLRTHANNAHNELVETWAQTGLLGLGAAFWLWTTFAAAARAWWRRQAPAGPIYAAFAAGAAGMLVDNLLNVSLHFAVPAFLFWWTVGAALAPLAARPVEAGAPGPAAKAGLRAGAVALVALCAVWFCYWQREVHYFAGFKLMRQKALPAAVKELEVSESWGPREVNSIYELGNGYAQEQRFEDAVAAYKRALRANAGYDEIYYNVGAITAVRLRQPAVAVPWFLVAHWINPVSPDVYASLSNLYLQDPARYGDAAIELLEQATRLLPDNPNNWNNLGYLFTLRRRWPEAQRCYEKALLLDPTLQIAERNLAAAAQQAGDPPPKLLQTLGRLRALEAAVSHQDYSARSLALAQSLDAELPGQPKVRFMLGGLLLAQRRPAEAAPVLEWVVARQPANLAARLNLAESYLALGRRDDALAQYRAAAGLDPANALVRKRLAELAGH